MTDIHRRYLAAGADIVETNTFGASPIGMEEFELPIELVREINAAAVSMCPAGVRRIQRADARSAAVRRRLDRPDDEADGDQHEGRRRQLSRRRRSTRWPTRTTQQVAALVEAGVDILLPETVIDTLNLKACLFAI